MTYKLAFTSKAEKEWKKLDGNLKTIFKKKLGQRLLSPKIYKDKIQGADNLYKIKLRDLAYRLIYEVKEDKLVVIVITVKHRDDIYKSLL